MVVAAKRKCRHKFAGVWELVISRKAKKRDCIERGKKGFLEGSDQISWSSVVVQVKVEEDMGHPCVGVRECVGVCKHKRTCDTS